MKRKYIDKEDWPRILEKRFKYTYINNEEFNGYVSIVYIDKVKEPLNVNMNGKEFCLADEGYIWLQHVPLNSNYAVTTMYNSNKEVVQWYFDVTKGNGVSENGRVFFDDLYLDVVVTPASEVILFDEDELEEALESNIITKEDYDLAYNEANVIMTGIATDVQALLSFSNKYLEYMEEIMTNSKLDFYYFGIIGEYDCYNPAYVCSSEYAAEILYLIAANDPFSMGKQEISKHLNINCDKIEAIVSKLQLINALEIKGNAYRIKFPVFLERDVVNMEKYINNVGELIGKKIMSLEQEIYEKIAKLKSSAFHSNERILYHIICDKVFDGTAFEFFKEKDTFCTSKLQPGDRDYIIVAYEHSEAVEKHSDKLLCSSNNYWSSMFTFNSFGDGNGPRKDIYRFFRIVQKGVYDASPFDEVNTSYNKILDSMNKDLALKCGELICKIINEDRKYNQFNEEEKTLINFLEELGYVDIDKNKNTISINTPVFYESENTTIIKELSDDILTSIFPIVNEVFESFQVNAADLTSVKHNVDIKEIANELWHQIFGATNEYLVKEGFVSSPPYTEGEGRYLRSFTVNDI
jgi:predicted RNA-binding protein associated with RNAse of E/G family